MTYEMDALWQGDYGFVEKIANILNKHSGVFSSALTGYSLFVIVEILC